MKRVLLIASGVAVALAVLFWPYTVGLFMLGKSVLAEGLQAFSGIREEPGPWQVIDPGKPNAVFPKPYVLQAGNGEAVQIGDIVTVRKYILDADATTVAKDMGRIWFWVGYRRPQDGRFYKCLKIENSCDVESGVVGLKTGSWFYYPINDVSVESWRNKDGHLDPRYGSDLVLGGGSGVFMLEDKTAFSHSLPAKPEPYLEQQFKNTFVAGGVGAMVQRQLYYLVQRCPAQLRQRTVKVSSGGPMVTGGLGKPDVTTLERRLWVLEAELKATCADGRVMTFQQGPLYTDPPPGESFGPAPPQGYWDDWFKRASAKIPMGLRIEPAPALGHDTITPELLAQVRATNARYAKPLTHGPRLLHNAYVVVAGEKTRLNLREGLCSHRSHCEGFHKLDRIKIMDYRTHEHTHGTVTRGENDEFFYTADPGYSGPAHFRIQLSETYDLNPGNPITHTNEADVPIEVMSPQEAAARAAQGRPAGAS